MDSSERVDIFIPVAANHAHVLPAAICSALTQTYPNKRLVLFLDGVDDRFDNVLNKWVYTPNDHPDPDKTCAKLSKVKNTRALQRDALVYEECERGVIIKNRAGPSETAHVGRQWLFEWEGKSPLVKMLDADDIMTPRGLEFMMHYVNPEVDGVFCPLLRCSGYRLAGANPPDPQDKQTGSGMMLLRREVMNTMIKEGYKWAAKRGHDRGFFEFIRDREEKFNFKVTNENFIYLYLR